MPFDLELACLVGGGVGIPPMLYLARALAAAACKQAVGFVGALRRDLLPVTLLPPPAAPEPSPEGLPLPTVAEFQSHSYPAVITTDDGSLGMKGFVTQALRRFLETRLRHRGTLAGTIVYCCGPTPMMKATAKVAAEFQIPCQVSLEQPMACGMGTCQLCISSATVPTLPRPPQNGNTNLPAPTARSSTPATSSGNAFSSRPSFFPQI